MAKAPSPAREARALPRKRRGRAPLFMCVARHQIALCERVTMHRRIQFGAACARFQIQLRIKRENLEKIVMSPGGRTWTTIIAFPEIVRALNAAGWRAVLADIARSRIDVPDNPMREQTARRIRIIDDQDKRLRLAGYAIDL